MKMRIVTESTATSTTLSQFSIGVLFQHFLPVLSFVPSAAKILQHSTLTVTMLSHSTLLKCCHNTTSQYSHCHNTPSQYSHCHNTTSQCSHCHNTPSQCSHCHNTTSQYSLSTLPVFYENTHNKVLTFPS